MQQQYQHQQQLHFSIPTLLRGITYCSKQFSIVLFIRYSNEKSELKTHN